MNQKSEVRDREPIEVTDLEAYRELDAVIRAAFLDYARNGAVRANAPPGVGYGIVMAVLASQFVQAVARGTPPEIPLRNRCFALVDGALKINAVAVAEMHSQSKALN